MAGTVPDEVANIPANPTQANPPLTNANSSSNLTPKTRKCVKVLGILLIVVGVASIILEAITRVSVSGFSLGIFSGPLNILAGALCLVWLYKNNPTRLSLCIGFSFASIVFSLIALLMSVVFYLYDSNASNCNKKCLSYYLNCTLLFIHSLALAASLMATFISFRHRQWNFFFNYRRPVMVFNDGLAYEVRPVGRGVRVPRNYVQQRQPLVSGPNIVYVDNQPFGYNQPHLLINQPATGYVYQAPSSNQQQPPVNEPSADWEQPPPSYNPAFAKQLEQQQQ